jgi:hypothetical protein
MATRLHIEQSKQSEEDGHNLWIGLRNGLPIAIALWLFLAWCVSRACAQELPDAPMVRQAMAHLGIKPIEINRFSDNPTNRWLLRADLGVRVNDAMSTYVMDGTGICPTCRETQLPASLAKSLPGMLAYSFAVHEGVKYGASLLWRHNHHKLARALVIGDIVGDAYPGIRNWTILSPKPIAATASTPSTTLRNRWTIK